MFNATLNCLARRTPQGSTKWNFRELCRKVEDIELPPEPKSCCLAGCTNCVWVEYAHKISKLLDGNDDKAREIILSKVSDPVLKSFLSIELKTIQQQSEN